jgi:undecaprenyl-diphosphatase
VFLLCALAVLVLAGWGLGGLVIPHIGAADAAAEAHLVTRDGTAVKAMQAVSQVGSGLVITVLAVAVILLLLRAQRVSSAIFVALSAGGATVVSQLVKALVDRPRPSLAQVAASGASFPSGHATEATAFYAALAVVAASIVGRRLPRLFIAVAVAIVVLGIAFSRLALGVHYPSDVAAGLLLGSLWVLVSGIATGQFHVAAQRVDEAKLLG